MKKKPSKELKASLKEIKDYEKVKIKLDTYKDVKDLRKFLLKK